MHRPQNWTSIWTLPKTSKYCRKNSNIQKSNALISKVLSNKRNKEFRPLKTQTQPKTNKSCRWNLSSKNSQKRLKTSKSKVEQAAKHISITQAWSTNNFWSKKTNSYATRKKSWRRNWKNLSNKSRLWITKLNTSVRWRKKTRGWSSWRKIMKTSRSKSKFCKKSWEVNQKTWNHPITKETSRSTSCKHKILSSRLKFNNKIKEHQASISIEIQNWVIFNHMKSRSSSWAWC